MQQLNHRLSRNMWGFAETTINVSKNEKLEYVRDY